MKVSNEKTRRAKARLGKARLGKARIARAVPVSARRGSTAIARRPAPARSSPPCIRALFVGSTARSILPPDLRGALGFGNWEKEELSALWPTTTACFMTSFHTGQAPSVHGIAGWWSYSEKDDLVVAPLTGRKLEDGLPAAPDGYSATEAVASPFVNRRGPEYDYRWFIPKSFWLSSFMNAALFSRRGLSRQPYAVFLDLAESFRWRARRMLKPPRWVVYLADYDHAAHHHGIASVEAALVALRINDLIENPRACIPSGVTNFLSADHGLLDVQKIDQYEIAAGHPLLDCLAVPPYGEPRQGLPRRNRGFRRGSNRAG